MKILHVIENFDTRSGGPPPVVAGMCETLSAMGHSVSLYANRSSMPYRQPGEVNYDLRLFDVAFSSFGVSLEMAKALRNAKSFDLIHIHMLYRFPQLAAAYCARMAGVPYCIQPHGALVDRIYNYKERKFSRHLYAQTVEKGNLAHAAALVFTAEFERDSAAELGFAGRRSYIVPGGVNVAELSRQADPGPFRQKYKLEGRNTLLWMGRLVHTKALDQLVNAFVQISRKCPDTVLVLAGPDPDGYGLQVRRWVQESGLDDRVVFTGMITGEEKQQAFAAADIFVFPSYTENFGVVALEAMAAGLPVILSKGISIWRELYEGGGAAIVESDAEQIAAATIDLLSDPGRRKSMGNAARQAAWSFDWTSVGRRLDSAYREIVK